MMRCAWQRWMFVGVGAVTMALMLGAAAGQGLRANSGAVGALTLGEAAQTFEPPPAPGFGDTNSMEEPVPADVESEASSLGQVEKSILASALREQAPLGDASRAGAAVGGGTAGTGLTDGLGRIIFSLLVVVALIIGLWSVMRRMSLGGGLMHQLGPGGRAPSGLAEILARYPVGRGQALVLLKLDRRILLLNQNPAGFNTLCDITDPEEVASILVKARDDEGDSMAGRFRSMLRSAERDPWLAEENGRAIGPTTMRQAWSQEAAPEVAAEPPPSRARGVDDAAAAIGSLRERLASLRGTSA